MVYRVGHPAMVAGITGDFLPLVFRDNAGPVVVAVEKSAIQYDPPGTMPENETERAVVAEAIGKQLEPLLPKLVSSHDVIRSTESGVNWRHLDLTAATTAENQVKLRTRAHYMLRHSSYGN